MRVLITAGPTREYLDAVRYLSNASSGRMGHALASAAMAHGHQVTLVQGPVDLEAPVGVIVEAVTSAQEMYEACLRHFANCDGAIAAAAVCDYRPLQRVTGKIKKTGAPLKLELIETVDVLTELGRRKGNRWLVGFALEAHDGLAVAVQKMREKNCDAIVLNHPDSIGSDETQVQIINREGRAVETHRGAKTRVAQALLAWMERELL